MIAIFRGITLGALPPVILMMGINLGAFLVSVHLVYRIIQAGGASDEISTIGAFLFGLWPFVGLTFTVLPLADLPGISLLLTGLYLLQGSRRLSAALFLGLSILTHKAMWLLVGLLIIAVLFRKEFISKRNLQFIGITLLPIGVLWLLGSYYHHSITWLFSTNLESEVASNSNIPILDGMLGTLMEGSLKGIVKGTIIMVMAISSAISLYASARLKYEYFHFGMVISAAVLILFLVLNQHEIWAGVRFSRLLAIPMALIANTPFGRKRLSWWGLPMTITVLIFFFLTQFAFAWYLARVYYG